MTFPVTAERAMEGILRVRQQPDPVITASGPSLAFVAVPPITCPWALPAYRPCIHAFTWLVAHPILPAKASPFEVDLCKAILARTGQLRL